MANANFTPDIGPYTTLKPFRFWCQKVLPLVYDDSLSYYELLGKVVDYLNKTMEDVDTQITDIQGLLSAYEALQSWVNAYYTSADFAAAIDDGLDRMAESGQLTTLLTAIVNPQLPGLVDDLLPEVVLTLLPDEVSSQIGGTVATQLPGVVSNQIPGTVATQLPAVVSNQIGGTVATQLPAVVSTQIGPVVEDKIVDPVEDWLDANVSGGIAVDRTLSVLGAGADAAFTGARLETLDNTLGYEHAADTGFIITTANPFAFNVEVINDIADFSDLGTHTYKMMVIPVNTGDKYCINAHKISIADITADHFAVTYAFCAKYVGDTITDKPKYLPTTYSANDAENVIVAAPEITIPTGQGYDETTGYLVVITANIEDPVYKVVDEGFRKDIADLKSDLIYSDKIIGIGENIADFSELAGRSITNWTVTSTSKYGFTVIHNNIYSTGYPKVSANLSSGTYVFYADFSPSADIDFRVDGSSTQILDTPYKKFTVPDDATTIEFAFHPSATGTYKVSNISIRPYIGKSINERVDDIVADYANDKYPYKNVTYIKGGMQANGNISYGTNGCLSSLIKNLSSFYIQDGNEVALSLYADGVYKGKIAADGTMNTTPGSWMRFNGLVDVQKYLNENNCKGIRFTLFPTEGTTIADNTAATTYANNNVIYSTASAVRGYVDQVASDTAPGQNYAVGADFLNRPLRLQFVGHIANVQSFCIYNGDFYSVTEGVITKQDSSFATVATNDNISFGHGNVCQLGKSHYAYVSGMSDNTVYKIDLDTLTISDTITLPTTGVTNAVIDEDRGLAYLFNRTDNGLTVDNHNFIVYDYINENVIMTKKTKKFAAMQACDLFNDTIILAYGLGTVNAPNGLDIYTTSGDCIASIILGQLSSNEPEGVALDRDTGELYISITGKNCYKVIPTTTG